MNKIIAVDFDGTMCKNEWPHIGEPNEEVLNYIISEKQNGAKLILWTNRSGQNLDEAVIWAKEHGVEFDAVNDNLPESIEYFGGNSRKIFATEFIDDRASTRFNLPYKGKVQFPFKGDLDPDLLRVQALAITSEELTELIRFLGFDAVLHYSLLPEQHKIIKTALGLLLVERTRLGGDTEWQKAIGGVDREITY